MQKEQPEPEIHEEQTEEKEEIKFGYGASIVFLIFIVFAIYYSIKG
jgi:hypothetical protein